MRNAAVKKKQCVIQINWVLARKKEQKLGAKNKIHTVMAEFKRGTLHSGSGVNFRILSRRIAIGLSEARKKRC